MTLLSGLRSAIGCPHVETDPRLLAPMLVDNRGRFFGRVLCAVFPASTREVSLVMQVCRRYGALVFTQGGNTGNAAAATPVVDDSNVARSVLVSLKRMNRVETVDPVNSTATVEAGAPLAVLQEAAAEAGKLFPLSLASEGTATIGGLLSTNAGGVHVIAYGNMREQCLGLEVVLEDGRVLNTLRGLRKDNTGYDLKQLFIGAEGTLGIITRAVLKLSDRPARQSAVLVSLPSLDAVDGLFISLHRTAGPALTAFELMHRDTIAMVRRMMPQACPAVRADSPWLVLAELSAFSEKDASEIGNCVLGLLEAMLEDGSIRDAVCTHSESQRLALWKMREAIPESFKAAGGNVKHDISVPRSSLAAFVRETSALLEARFDWIAPSVFGHFGDGNLHYNAGVRDGLPNGLCFAHEEEIHRIVYEQVQRHGGSVAAEHGIGRLKAGLLETVKSPVEMAVMRAIKDCFDPEGLLNPGAVLRNAGGAANMEK